MVNKIIINNSITLKRLTLKYINKNYLSWLDDASLKKNLVNVNFKNIRQLRQYYQKIIKKKNLFFFGIFYKERHIGNIKFENIFMHSAIASWGILIGDRKFRGKKIGYEVLSKSMSYFEKKFKIENFIISVTHFNESARKLYFNLGFRKFKVKNNKIFLIKKCLFSKIVLGSANFTNQYGIKKKYVSKARIRNILKHAEKYGINFIDTANNYGKSEETLGTSKAKNFKIISKLSKIDKNIINVEKYIEKKFSKTLNRTNRKSIYGYLVHNSEDLLSNKGKTIIKTLRSLKKRNKIKKIGVSVYEVNQLKKILTFFKPDIVQIPINILNQNFLKNNFLKKIKKYGIEIHVRSVFLQGLLLENNAFNFERIVNKKLDIIDKICKKKRITRLNFLLSFINSIKEIDKIVIGIDSCLQLEKIIKCMQKIILIKNYKNLAVSNLSIIDPRFWHNKNL